MVLSASNEERELFGECWNILTRKQRIRVFAKSDLKQFERVSDVISSSWDDFGSDNQVRLIEAMAKLGDVCFR